MPNPSSNSKLNKVQNRRKFSNKVWHQNNYVMLPVVDIISPTPSLICDYAAYIVFMHLVRYRYRLIIYSLRLNKIAETVDMH